VKRLSDGENIGLLISQFLTNADALLHFAWLGYCGNQEGRVQRHGREAEVVETLSQNKLKIQSGDTPATVRARVRYILQKYEPEDVDKLLDIWCDVGNQVGQYFNCNNVLLVIVIV
jgi:hypothetical protein